MKLAFFSAKKYEREFFDRFAPAYGHQVDYFEASLDSSTANLSAGYDGVCVFVNDRLDAKTIAHLAANGIRLIALRCAGYNNVDLAAAKNHGIAVVRVPAYSPQAIAEHTVALILTLTRKTHKAYNRVKEGNFSLDQLMGFNLYGKTVGVIGTGQIGTAFCKIMRGFGCRVMAHDIQESPVLSAEGVSYTTLDELLRSSDIISLHCPLTPLTLHLLNEASLAKVKTGIMIINTSRGGLINGRDMINALKTGKVGYLGIDVYEQEEQLFFKDLTGSVIQDDVFERLLSFHNVLITPHQAFFTVEALEQITKITLQNITDVEDGQPLVNEIKI